MVKPRTYLLDRAGLDRALRHAFCSDDGLGHYYNRNLYVGQGEACRQLTDIIMHDKPGTVAIISEPFGFGKTSFVYTVIDSLVEAGMSSGGWRRVWIDDLGTEFREFRKPDDCKKPDWTILDRTKIKSPVDDTPKVLFIEEFDIKISEAEIRTGLTQAGSYLGKDVPIIVVTGDYVLRNPELLKLLGSPFDPKYVSLEPLSQEIFREAVLTRLRSATEGKANDLQWNDILCVYDDEKESYEIKLDDLFEPSIWELLIPNTNPPIALFRESFGILGGMFRDSSLYENLDSAPRVSRSAIRRAGFGKLVKTEVADFAQRLYDFIRQSYKPGVKFESLTSTDLMKYCPVEKFSEHEYRSRVILPAIKAGVLKSLGVPYLKPDDKRPGPYLPSQKSFVLAMCDA